MNPNREPSSGSATTYSRREQRAWYLYDWANSAFFTTVVALFMGPYLTRLAGQAADAKGFVHPFGFSIDARSFWSYLVSLSVILQVLFLPLAGAIADYGRRKKELLAATAYTGSAAALLMFFLTDGRYILGAILFLISNVSMGASVVVYNSFLPEIAPPEQRDSVSSKGWALGYAGGGALLSLNLLLYMRAPSLGISQDFAVRISLASAGAWCAIFTIPVLLVLRNRGPARPLPPGKTALGAATQQFTQTLSEVRRYPETLKFLAAYLLYNDAIQAVLVLATQFGNDDLKIPFEKLTLAFLMAQFVGISGALAFNVLASRIKAKRAIAVSLVVWTMVLVYVYQFVYTTVDFFIAVAWVALVMGGSQALSRSLFAQFIPKGREAEYFGVYEITDKGTSWLSPLLFGVVLQATGSYRVAILSLIVFFLAGLWVLTRVNVTKGEREAAARE
jgi:UMF1 family MFS transporter